MASLLEDTRLLCHFDGTDGATSSEDSSQYEHTITFFGNVELDTADYQFETASALFSGTDGDAISCGHSDDFNLFGDTTSDKTVEFWIKHDGAPSANQMAIQYRQNASSTNGRWQLLWVNSANGYRFEYYDDSNTQRIQSSVVGTANTTWTHWAIVKEANQITIYQAGTQVYQTTFANTASLGSAVLWLGTNGGTFAPFKGWMDEVRIINQAVYTSNFTPPTSEFETGGNIYKDLELEYNAGYHVNEDLEFLNNIYDIINRDLELAYDNGFLVHNDLQLLNNIFSLVRRNLEINYDNGFLVHEDSEFVYGLYNAVNKNLQLNYDNGFIVNQKIIFQYLIRALRNRSLEFPYDNGANVNNSVEFLYKIINAVNNDLILSYDNGYVVNSSLNFIYALSAYVSHDLMLRYFIERKVRNDLQFSYNFGSLVSKDIQFLYDLGAFAGKNLVFPYHRGDLVDSDLEFLYGISVGQNLIFPYNKGSQIESHLEFPYNSQSYKGRNLKFEYGIRWDVRKNIRFPNNILQIINRNLELLYNIYGTVFSDLELLYKILSSISKDFEFLYAIEKGEITQEVVDFVLNLQLNKTLEIKIDRLINTMQLKLPEQSIELKQKTETLICLLNKIKHIQAKIPSVKKIQLDLEKING